MAGLTWPYLKRMASSCGQHGCPFGASPECSDYASLLPSSSSLFRFVAPCVADHPLTLCSHLHRFALDIYILPMPTCRMLPRDLCSKPCYLLILIFSPIAQAIQFFSFTISLLFSVSSSPLSIPPLCQPARLECPDFGLLLRITIPIYLHCFSEWLFISLN